MRARQWLEWGVDLLYPPRCPFCGRILPNRWTLVCPDCAPQEEKAIRRPARVEQNKHSFYCIEQATALYRYHHPLVNQGILRMKSSEPWYAASFARLMAVRLYGYHPQKGSCLLNLSLGYDLLIPVPDSKGSRGYWVPGMMADQLGKLTGLPVEKKALVKVKATRRQAGLEREERMINLIGAFQVMEPRRIEGKRILLLDDVITTGSTVSCGAQALLEGGASMVSALSLAVSEQEGKL